MDIKIEILSIYFIIIIINILYGFNVGKHNIALNMRNKKYSVESVLAIVLLIFITLIIFADKDNPDYLGYMKAYDAGKESINVGYNVIVEFAKKIGLSFDLFRLSIYAISYGIIYKVIEKLGINKNIAFGLYAIFPFMYDGIQIRSFLSGTIILFSITFLIDLRKSGLIKYIIGVVIATTFHSVSIVYLVLILTRIDLNKKKKQWILSALFLISLLITLVSLFGYNTNFVSYLINLFEANTTEEKFLYYNTGIQFKQILLLIIQQLCFLLASFYTKRISKNNLDDTQTRDRLLTELIFNCNLALCCELPLLLVTTNFYRIFRNVHLLNYGIPGLLLKDDNKDYRFYLAFLFFFMGFLGNTIWNYRTDTAERIFWVWFN